MCNDQIRVVHVKGLNYVLSSHTFLATVCSSVGLFGRPADLQQSVERG